MFSSEVALVGRLVFWIDSLVLNFRSEAILLISLIVLEIESVIINTLPV